jgi:hypothetical protein
MELAQQAHRLQRNDPTTLQRMKWVLQTQLMQHAVALQQVQRIQREKIGNGMKGECGG